MEGLRQSKVCEDCGEAIEEGHDCSVRVATMKAHALKIKKDKVTEALVNARRMIIMYGSTPERQVCNRAFKRALKRR